MSFYSKRIQYVDEPIPSQKWLDFYNDTRAGYKKWFLEDGLQKKPSLSKCRSSLVKYMPELERIWDNLIKISASDEEEARMLSMYCPSSYKRGCTQAVWTRYNPVLVRNYDYSPLLFEGRVIKSRWADNDVIATSDCLWGALDGINSKGLSVSLAYGGNDHIGDGFGISLVLRYILEFGKSTQDAIDILNQVPINMAYNITIVDKLSHVVTVELTPSDNPKVINRPFAVNQQGDFDINHYALFSNSSERSQTIHELLFDPLVSIESFITAFGYAPLFSSDYDNNFGTLYTAVFNPLLKACEYHFPNTQVVYQSFDHFIEQDLYVTY